jgi:hypothetical protein
MMANNGSLGWVTLLLLLLALADLSHYSRLFSTNIIIIISAILLESHRYITCDGQNTWSIGWNFFVVLEFRANVIFLQFSRVIGSHAALVLHSSSSGFIWKGFQRCSFSWASRR